jgi:hypothetical protein
MSNISKINGFQITAESASFATTASYVLNGGVGSTFPYTGSALITGSLGITGSLTTTSDVVISGSLTTNGNITNVGNGADIQLEVNSVIATANTWDFTNTGTSSGAGLVLPLTEPSSPQLGSFYYDGTRLNIWNGSGWDKFSPD